MTITEGNQMENYDAFIKHLQDSYNEVIEWPFWKREYCFTGIYFFNEKRRMSQLLLDE